MTLTIFAAANLLLAAILHYLNWRLSPDPRIAWVLAACVLISCELLSLAGLAFYDSIREPSHSDWPFHVVAVSALAALVLALLGLRRIDRPATDPLGIGLGLGLITAGCLLLPSTVSVPTPTWVLLTVIASSHVALAVSVVCNPEVSRPAAALLMVSIALVLAGILVVPAGLSGTVWEVVIAGALAVMGVAWIVAAFEDLRRDAAREQRHSSDLEDTLLTTVDSDRRNRERLHELRSTLAGLVNASGLLQRREIQPELRRRLEDTVRHELRRMQRLLAGEKGPPTAIDLDTALKVIVDLQKLKGRQVEFTPSGNTVQGRHDDLAEIVGILVDNAATHGRSDDSVVSVTRSNGETVEIAVTDHGLGIPAHERERMFGWGERGEGSSGQGIGLNVAQRLVGEGGGTLTCVSTVGGGSSFVISLPAVRPATENHHAGTPH